MENSSKGPQGGLLARMWHKALAVSIFWKITLMLAICLTGYVSSGLLSFSALGRISHRLERLEDAEAPLIKVVHDISKELQSLETIIRSIDSSRSRELNVALIKRSEKELDAIRGLLEPLENGGIADSPMDADSLAITPFKERGTGVAFDLSIWNEMAELKQDLKEFKVLMSSDSDPNPQRIDTLRLRINGHLLAMERIMSAVSLGISQEKRGVVADILGNIKNYKIKVTVLVGIIMLFLTLTSYAWGWLLVSPLRRLATILQEIMKASGEDSSCSSIKLVPVFGEDEIGKVAIATNNLIQRIRKLCAFRRVIEGDETADDIYMRLAKVFREELGLHSFVIFEVGPEGERLDLLYSYPKELGSEIPDICPAERCRAVRTGSIVSSQGQPGICQVFPWPDALTHTCIPMQVGGEILGVIQFIYPFVDNPRREAGLVNTLSEANQYLVEALPVLKAKRLAQTLQEMAMKDPLTCLHNRRYLENYLDTLVAGVRRRGSSMGILMCDIDYFKQVNDEFGHDTGDLILANLAKILGSHVRDSDLVIRFGGEEFLVLLIDCELDEAITTAERIRRSVEETVFRIGTTQLKKTISIGISEFPGDSDAIWQAIKFADVALYRAKEKGRNQVLRFTRDMWQGMDY